MVIFTLSFFVVLALFKTMVDGRLHLDITLILMLTWLCGIPIRRMLFVDLMWSLNIDKMAHLEFAIMCL